jgi:hypothetical protein
VDPPRSSGMAGPGRPLAPPRRQAAVDLVDLAGERHKLWPSATARPLAGACGKPRSSQPCDLGGGQLRLLVHPGGETSPRRRAAASGRRGRRPSKAGTMTDASFRSEARPAPSRRGATVPLSQRAGIVGRRERGSAGRAQPGRLRTPGSPTGPARFGRPPLWGRRASACGPDGSCGRRPARRCSRPAAAHAASAVSSEVAVRRSGEQAPALRLAARVAEPLG